MIKQIHTAGIKNHRFNTLEKKSLQEKVKYNKGDEGFTNSFPVDL